MLEFKIGYREGLLDLKKGMFTSARGKKRDRTREKF